MERMAHSELKQVLKLSNPTLPDYGINKAFQETDQRYWLLKCEKCNAYTCLEDTFPDCLLELETDKVTVEVPAPTSGVLGDLAVEAGQTVEVGAVLGHESGPPPPYEQLFASGQGFTDVGEAKRFVAETGCDWLSVAVGNIHGAVSGALKDHKKVEARLHIEHLRKLHEATNVPLVLHGGSGVQRSYLLEATRNGMTKVNIGTEIRQAYEQELRDSSVISKAQQSCYQRTRWLLKDYFGLSGTRRQVFGGAL